MYFFFFFFFDNKCIFLILDDITWFVVNITCVFLLMLYGISWFFLYGIFGF